MAYQTLSLGLTLTIPTNGTKNWGTTLYNTTWTKISQHGHTGSGDGAKMVTGSYTDNSVTGAKLAKNIFLTQYATTLTPVGTTQTIDFNNGNIQKLNLGSASGNVTLTLSNPASGALYTIFVIQGATARTLIFPAGVLWPQGVAPILSTTNGAVDKIKLYYDGTNYYGDWEVLYS
jgi:hypothetical protein